MESVTRASTPHAEAGGSAPAPPDAQPGGTGAGSPRPTGLWPWVLLVLGASASLFQLYTGGFGIFSSMIQRSVHWTFMSVLIFLLYPARKTSKRTTPGAWDLLFAALALIAGLYIFFNWEAVVERAGMAIERDIYFGVVMVIVVLEATRRAVGAVLAWTAAAFLLYAYFGPWMPGIFAHKGYSIERIVTVMYTSTEGIFGIPMAVSSTYIVLFVLFGAFLSKCGGGRFFIDFAYSLTGRLRGGPAKTAVISSAFMGTMSGSAVANVVTTGTFTIPLMKRTGYPAHVAGAVEAVASTGGQIMPPIMGAAAFIMSEFTEIPYVTIAAAAVIPALLYFFSVYLFVDLQAIKQGLKGLPREDLPRAGATLAWGGHLFLPLLVLVLMLVWAYSPMKSVFWGIVLIVVVGMMRKTTRVSPWKLVEALEFGARNAVTVAAACAAAGIIVGVIALTGLGLKFSDSLVSFSGGNILLALFFTMIASLILGCGMPTTAAYVVLASLAAPVLVRLGVPVLAAHMFIFYFGCISTITPPVALSSYAGAAIAEADPMRVSNTAVKFGLVAYIVPYMMVYGPSLLMQGDPVRILTTVFTAAIGVFAFATGLQGYLRRECAWWERAVLIAAGLCLIFPGWRTDLTGILALLAVWGYQGLFSRRTTTASGARRIF
ncbi:MAG: TRAP transporter permease [Candidatus Tectomicrobia bacterium]|nr:TRAP transporter permease [Candidatus Tectomicrobia bacterium]